MDSEETQRWQAAIADATDLRLINMLIKIAQEQNNREAARMVAVKAKSMGFVASKELGRYIPKQEES